MSTTPTYWFHAKRTGIGWGMATCWQGWAVYAGYLALCGVGAAIHAETGRDSLFQIIVVVATLTLLAICWRKGEPARWRWRGD